MTRLKWITLGVLASVSLAVLAQVSYNYFAPGGALSCTGNCTQQSVNLAAGSSFITGILPQSNILTCAANQIWFDNASGLPSCDSKFTYATATASLSIAPTNVSPGGIVCSGSCQNALTQPLIPLIGASSGTSEVLMWGIGTTANPSATCKFAGCLTDTGEGDLVYESTFSDPTWGLTMSDNTASNFGQMFIFQGPANTGQQINLGIDTFATTNCKVPDGASAISPAPLTNRACAFIWLGAGGATGTTVTPFVIAQQVSPTLPLSVGLMVAEGGNNIFFGLGATTAVKWLQASSTGTNQATATLGDTNAASVTNVRGGSAANTQINGSPACSNATGCPATSTALSATTGSIGGSLLAAGGCSSGTVSLSGATLSMAAIASPAGGTNPDPGSLGVYWRSRVSSANTITVDVCTPLAGTPNADTYNVRVLQ